MLQMTAVNKYGISSFIYILYGPEHKFQVLSGSAMCSATLGKIGDKAIFVGI